MSDAIWASVQAPLTIPDKGRSQYELALANLLEYLRRGNPELAQALHDHNGYVPYSAHVDDRMLHAGLLDWRVLKAFMAGAGPLATARSFTPCTLLDNDGGRLIQLRFVTPTVFRISGVLHACPNPALVFGGLCRRWQAFGGPELPQMPWPAVKRLNIRTEKVVLEQRSYGLWGFIGSVTFFTPENEGVQRVLHGLAQFGELCGVGSHVAWGMGRVKYILK